MMKAKPGLANALVHINSISAKYNINNKSLQLAKFQTCGGKDDFYTLRSDFHNSNLESPTTQGSGPTSTRCGPNSSPVTSTRCAGGDKQYIINNKARKAIVEQGYCT